MMHFCYVSNTIQSSVEECRERLQIRAQTNFLGVGFMPDDLADDQSVTTGAWPASSFQEVSHVNTIQVEILS